MHIEALRASELFGRKDYNLHNPGYNPGIKKQRDYKPEGLEFNFTSMIDQGVIKQAVAKEIARFQRMKPFSGFKTRKGLIRADGKSKYKVS